MTVSASPARPLRALGLVVGLWIVGRGAFLWMEAGASSIVAATGPRLPRPLPLQTDPPREALRVDALPSIVAGTIGLEPFRRPAVRSHVTGSIGDTPGPNADPPIDPAAKPPALPSRRSTEDTATTAPTAPTVAPEKKAGVTFAAWSGSFWLAAREGAAPGLAAGGGQLGGGQAGVRVYRHLTPAFALTGRLSSALSTPQTEASAGFALRRGAFAVLAERRIALDAGGRNDWSLTAVAGVDDVALPLGLRLNGYAQGGIVGRDAFADGAVRVERTIVEQGAIRLAVGAGSWGSAPPGLARLDIGPHIVARTRLAGQPLRVSAEWRQRIAGNAQPGSGPVVTLGADF